MGDWTRALLALVRDGRDDAGRTTGPRIPWWARAVHRQAGQQAVAAAAAGGAADVEKGGDGKAADPSPSASDEGGGAGDSLALRPDMPTVYLQGPFGAPAMAFERYSVLVLAATGVG